MLFVCPKCKEKLNTNDQSAVCKNGHSYDKNKKGFYNLFLSSRGGNHGDNRDMVESRRRFLDGGFYEPLCKTVSELVCEYMPKFGAALDIGCGEGYYTDKIEKALSASDKCAYVCAFDISRDAITLARRRNPNIEYAVAGAYDMPIADESINVAINMFSPLAPDEILRVLEPNGIFIMAIPAEEHLFGLKSVLYDAPYKNKVADTAISGFELISDKEIKYILTLDNTSDILSLFGMTPYAYRTGIAGRERIEKMNALTTDVHFRAFVYKKL